MYLVSHRTHRATSPLQCTPREATDIGAQVAKESVERQRPYYIRGKCECKGESDMRCILDSECGQNAVE